MMISNSLKCYSNQSDYAISTRNPLQHNLVGYVQENLSVSDEIFKY